MKPDVRIISLRQEKMTEDYLIWIAFLKGTIIEGRGDSVEEAVGNLIKNEAESVESMLNLRLEFEKIPSTI